jgi:hypothetical protein
VVSSKCRYMVTCPRFAAGHAVYRILYSFSPSILSVQAVVATIAFGMGIDKSDIRWVVHLCLSGSLEAFSQVPMSSILMVTALIFEHCKRILFVSPHMHYGAIMRDPTQ